MKFASDSVLRHLMINLEFAALLAAITLICSVQWLMRAYLASHCKDWDADDALDN